MRAAAGEAGTLANAALVSFRFELSLPFLNDSNSASVLLMAYAGIHVNGGVAVLLGNGDGSFQAAQHLRASDGPISVVVVDLNGDGAADLAVANETSHGVSVLLGNGDGSFQSARTFGTGMSPKSVAVGDFNGDGMTDLAVANAYTLITPRGSFHDWGVSALINNTPP